MENIQGIDVIMIAIVGLSALFAFGRGFTGEMLKIGVWVASSAVGVYAVPDIQPALSSYISNPAISNVVAFSVASLVTWMLLKPLCNWISTTIKNSELRGLDRSLGVVYGVVRGGVYLFLLYFLVVFLAPHRADEFREKSEIFRRLDSAGEEIRDHFSDTFADYIKDYLKDAGAEGVDASEISKRLSERLNEPLPDLVEK